MDDKKVIWMIMGKRAKRTKLKGAKTERYHWKETPR
jgi:hypothetical protein